MRVQITPGGKVEGLVTVPGDKSVAHRWLILASTARGTSRLTGVPPSLDVRSMAACLAAVAPSARPALEAWARKAAPADEKGGSTWNDAIGTSASWPLEVEGEGRSALSPPVADLDCGNSGTAMRLLAGVLAAAPFRSVLTGDESLRSRPMERVADPLRQMGAGIETQGGRAPLVIDGRQLQGVRHRLDVPTAQVKGAILLAGLAADGRTTVVEPAPTRDHTERALIALGAPVEVEGASVSVERFQHGGFEGEVPGDPSSAAFLVAAAALTGAALTIEGVGLNPSRTAFLDVMGRMGVRVERAIERIVVGEPVGTLRVEACTGLQPARVTPEELPLVIDEVPVLALMAAHAPGDTWFLDAGELRVKESDRLTGVAEGIEALGGHAAVEGNDLVVAGGGLTGGRARAGGDHRLAMAFAVAALAADGPSVIDGMEAADVSFPGFAAALAGLGARLEVVG